MILGKIEMIRLVLMYELCVCCGMFFSLVSPDDLLTFFFLRAHSFVSLDRQL